MKQGEVGEIALKPGTPAIFDGYWKSPELDRDVFSGGWQETTYRFNQIQVLKQGMYVTPFVEWKPRPDFSFRIELDNVTARGRHYVYQNFAGSRGAAPREPAKFW